MDWKTSCRIYWDGRRCSRRIHLQSIGSQGKTHFFNITTTIVFRKVISSLLTSQISNMVLFQDPDPRKMQINLTGFLNGKNARIFMGELWKLLDSAQNNDSGIPQEMIDKKKEEIKNRRVRH